MLWEQHIPGIDPAFGVIHGSDLLWYFPLLYGAESDPRSLGQSDLVSALHTAVVNFVSHGHPNGCWGQSDGYEWPDYADGGLITAMNASRVAVAEPPPQRPGFEVLHQFLHA
jgi:carboxylesterase type B